MNALGNLHLDAAIPVTVAAMNLKVIRVSHKTPFMLRRGYEDLSGALRCSSVCSSVLSCALSCALLFALLRAPVRSWALLGLAWALLSCPVLSWVFLCLPGLSWALPCGWERQEAENILCCLGLLSLGSFGFPDKVICHAGDHQHVTNKTEQYSNSVLVMRTGAAQVPQSCSDHVGDISPS